MPSYVTLEHQVAVDLAQKAKDGIDEERERRRQHVLRCWRSASSKYAQASNLRRVFMGDPGSHPELGKKRDWGTWAYKWDEAGQTARMTYDLAKDILGSRDVVTVTVELRSYTALRLWGRREH